MGEWDKKKKLNSGEQETALIKGDKHQEHFRSMEGTIQEI